MTRSDTLLLRDIWPYADVEATPEIAMQPVSIFADPLATDTFRTIDVTAMPLESPWVDIPAGGYAILLDCQGGRLTVGHLEPHTARWIQGRSFKASDLPDFRVVLECRTVLLESLNTDQDLELRVERLTKQDLRTILGDKILGMIGGLGGTMLTFLSLRLGLGAHALDLFLLLLGLAVLSGVIGLTAQAHARDVEAKALARLSAQFAFERGLQPDGPSLDPRTITRVSARRISSISEITTLGGFAILMCFVMFFVPAVTLAAFVAIVLAALVLSLNTRSPGVEKSIGQLQVRLARALLSVRSTRTEQMVPRQIPEVRRRVLRDQVGRYKKIAETAARETIEEKLLQDVAQAICLVLVLGGYLLSLQMSLGAGGATGMAQLTDTPIIEMAPVLMLFSLAMSSARVAQVILAYGARLVSPARPASVSPVQTGSTQE